MVAYVHYFFGHFQTLYAFRCNSCTLPVSLQSYIELCLSLKSTTTTTQRFAMRFQVMFVRKFPKANATLKSSFRSAFVAHVTFHIVVCRIGTPTIIFTVNRTCFHDFINTITVLEVVCKNKREKKRLC